MCRQPCCGLDGVCGLVGVACANEDDPMDTVGGNPYAFPKDTSGGAFPLDDLGTPPPTVPSTDTFSEPSPPDASAPGGACVEGAVTDYPACCDHGPARCVPAEKVDLFMHPVFGPCEDETSLCVPESVFERSGTFKGASCSSILGLEGACATKCAPQMAAYLDTLPQDICSDAELCAPCVSPLDMKETGSCDPFSCTGDFGHPLNPDNQINNQPSCDNPPTEPLVSVDAFPECCDGAYCVPVNLVGEDLASDLAPCNGGVCVPEPYIAYAGFFTPEACEMPGGIEGRCVSTCIPSVQEMADLLPQANCKANERCSPCCDPMTGEETGACAAGCDSWPEEVGFCEVTYQPCCEGEGHCLPDEILPEDQLKSLDPKLCEQDGYRCVPDVLTDPNYVPGACSGTLKIPKLTIPFIEFVPYKGVCLSGCLKMALDGLIPKGSCM